MNKTDKESLLDTIHKCLKCNKEAYEYEKDNYVCSDKECDFTWTVKHCE